MASFPLSPPTAPSVPLREADRVPTLRREGAVAGRVVERHAVDRVEDQARITRRKNGATRIVDVGRPVGRKLPHAVVAELEPIGGLPTVARIRRGRTAVRLGTDRPHAAGVLGIAGDHPSDTASISGVCRLHLSSRSEVVRGEEDEREARRDDVADVWVPRHEESVCEPLGIVVTARRFAGVVRRAVGVDPRRRGAHLRSIRRLRRGQLRSNREDPCTAIAREPHGVDIAQTVRGGAVGECGRGVRHGDARDRRPGRSAVGRSQHETAVADGEADLSPVWNSMSFSGTPPGARVWRNEPSACRVKIAPADVVNQNRVADWYSMAVMFWDVPLEISVQMPADAGCATTAGAMEHARTARARRRRRGVGICTSPSSPHRATGSNAGCTDFRAVTAPLPPERRRAPC